MSAGPQTLAPLSWFAVPVWTDRLGDRFSVDDAISHVEARRRTDGGVRRSNVGGWHSGTDLHLREEFRPLTNAISQMVTAAMHSIDFDFERYALHLHEMWAVVNPPSTRNELHVHPGSHLSAVVYLRTPERCGNIRFLDPVPSREMLRLPTKEAGALNAGTASVRAEPGLAVIFPAWLQHEVGINEGNEDRIALSMNFTARPKPTS